MLVQIELLILIKDENQVTAYFINRETSILLSHMFEDWDTSSTASLELVNSLVRTFDATPLCIEIDPNKCQAELSVISNKNLVKKVQCDMQTALLYAQKFEVPILTQTETLQNNGILISKEFIEETLQC